MKLFRFTTTIAGRREPFVDWYEGATEAYAKADWDEDCHRYGLPLNQVTVTIVECDPQTLKPISP